MRKLSLLSELYRPPLTRQHIPGLVRLDKNEPPYSAFETVDGLFRDSDMESLRQYPDLYPLYERLAAFTEVNIDQLLLTQGSEQAIRSIFDVFVDSDDEVMFHGPSFAMYEVFAYTNRARVIRIPFCDDLTYSLERILSAISSSTRLFVLANPHNFTGATLTFDELRMIAEHTAQTETYFLLDEAYLHYYCTPSHTLLHDHPHLILTRTFSKAFGLAGCRIGYAVAQKSTIELLRKIKPIDEISQLAAILGVKALDSHESILRRNVEQVSKWQRRFKEASLCGRYIPTHANFILFRSQRYDHHVRELLKRNIQTRTGFSEPCLRDCIRFSVHEDVTMATILEILSI